MSSTSEGDGSRQSNTKNSKQVGKKRRFLQQAHPKAPQLATVVSPTKLSKVANANNPNNVNGNNTSSDAPKSNNVRRTPPLQSSKSIEELESILEKRWGTAASSSSSGGKNKAPRGDKSDDADFVMSFGNDDDDYDYDDNSSGYKPKQQSLKGAAVFRSNRVVDPWAKEDATASAFDKAYRKNKSDEDEDERVSKREGEKREKYNRDEAMLNRVRSNQERLQGKRGNRFGGDEDGPYDVPVDVSQDYYDEDDEGYESFNQRKSIVSPRPVGGKGSSASSLSGGIFSNNVWSDKRETRTEADGASNEGKKKDEKAKKSKRKEPQLPPLLDEDGNEMYLTLEQAERIVQNILSVECDNDGDESDGGGSSNQRSSTWEDVGITHPTLLSNLQSRVMVCPAPLPVQEKACPPIVAGNDLLVSTHTGSGKTLAFLAPIAQNILINAENEEDKSSSSAFPKAIVLAPGRELASQIVSVAQTLFADTGLKVSMAIGGTPYSRNVETMRKNKPDLVVGTPGRIAELILGRPGDKGGKLKISGLQTIVLDECDALLQYDSHKEPTAAIMEAINRQHGESLQRVLCSATASDLGGSNVEQYLRPGFAHASIDEDDLLVTAGVKSKTKGGAMTTSARVSRTTIHGALHVPHRRLALEAVRKLLNTEPVPQQALIFVDSPRRVDIVIEKVRTQCINMIASFVIISPNSLFPSHDKLLQLAEMSIIAAPLHGGAGSGKGDRAEVNKALREGYVGIVVATEMAARGIDAPYLTHVINLDLPTDASHYAHRAGRCGRGGRPGVAVSITCDGKEKGVPKRLAEELGITMYSVEAREGKLRIVQG